MEALGENEVHNCVISLRANPQRRREKVRIGCGAGFGGDRPLAALKLLQKVTELDYLVLECLAERTLADRCQIMLNGGEGYDSRIKDWMRLLLPLAVERGTCIITNMGAMDPPGAQDEVLEIGSILGLDIVVAVAHETQPGVGSLSKKPRVFEGGISTYLGAAPIVEALEKFKPNVIITSRVADAALFLAPMVYELGWDWDYWNQLAQGSMAAHLLECGCQLTGGYFMHPGDKHRNISSLQLLDLSLPFAEVSYEGKVWVAKADGSGGVLNLSTCAEQLLYEVGDPGAYITPDVVIDFREVSFQSISHNKVLCAGAKPSASCVPQELLQLVPKDCGWKGWGEISYGGHGGVARAKAAEFLVRSWMEESFPAISNCIISYIIGLDSLKAHCIPDNTELDNTSKDLRLHMDGLFEEKEHAVHFTQEFTALYTNGPAGGGGISTGHKREILLEKHLVRRDHVFWLVGAKKSNSAVRKPYQESLSEAILSEKSGLSGSPSTRTPPTAVEYTYNMSADTDPAPFGVEIPLYNVAHSRAGDKGNDLNFSIIPHCPSDVKRLKAIVTPQWVRKAVSILLNPCTFPNSDAIEKRDKLVSDHVEVEIYEVHGIHSLNIVVRNILDGGVNCSRRIDRHGKTISDLILCQRVVLPP